MADSKLCNGCQRGEEDVNAVAWCSNCSELVCKVCARVHERISPPHKVIPMKEIQQLSSSLLNLSKNFENHPEEKKLLYCCQHDKVICDSCVTVSHQNCKPIISIEKAARGVKVGTAISDLERRLDNLGQVTENILSHSEATLEELTKSRNSIKKRVSEIKQKFIAHLEKLEADIHKDIDNKYKHCNVTVSRNKDNIQSSADLLSIWKNDLKSLRQHLSEIHLFEIVKCLDAKTHHKELEIREIQKATVPLLRYHPQESGSNLNKLLPDLGTIMVDNLTVPKPLLNIDQRGQFLVRDHQMLSLTHSFKTTKLDDEVKIYRGCFLPDKRLILSGYRQRNLYVCKLDGSNSKTINLKYQPECITLYDNNYAVVSLGEEGIQIIDLLLLKPGRIINIKPKCVCITNVNDTICVHNQLNTLTKVDIYGKMLNTIQSKFNPWEICANKEGDVYCTDRCSNKVYIVTSDGIVREIFGSSDLRNPHCVAVDNNGDVFVAGMNSNNIHRISSDGRKHDIILTENDGIDRPTGLSYNCETREL
ncbi:E3 ubiquitin-protein ligase TRIM71-like [Mytilus edulis]|uniref:E3 ubiquitin-protein ligase TRIM71-like n=1 Tax=Mytilus edulis TaxID=6550 RepID=UPI0039F120BC